MDETTVVMLIILAVVTVAFVSVFFVAWLMARVTGKDNILWAAKRDKTKDEDDI